MYFSRVELVRSASINRLAGLLGGNEYRDHQIIWKLFPGVDKRDFIFRREERGGWPIFFIVSARPPVMGEESLWMIQTKEYEPKVQISQRLAFTLRVNPVRSKPEGKESKRGKRHDVVMEAKSRLKLAGTSRDQWKPTPELVAEEGWKWLSARAPKHGFAVAEDGVRVDGYRQHWLTKNGRDPIRFSTLDYQGVLTVEDSEMFLETLYQGLGSAKGFGCGLLMVRRP